MNKNISTYCIPGYEYQYVVEFTYICTSGPFKNKEDTFTKTFQYRCPNELKHLTISTLKDGYKLLFTQEMEKRIQKQNLPYTFTRTKDISFSII